MVGSNFTACGQRYMTSPNLIARWNYTGPTRLIPNNPETQITYEGCKVLCGTEPHWYSWDIASNTITTWVLPIIGTLLQAPFESNAFWRTVKASCRWIGSPIASLAYILWNIEVSGKCALFGMLELMLDVVFFFSLTRIVDMATPYEGPLPGEDSDFSSMRDSFYILMNIHQYKMKSLISMTKEYEAACRLLVSHADIVAPGQKAYCESSSLVAISSSSARTSRSAKCEKNLHAIFEQTGGKASYQSSSLQCGSSFLWALRSKPPFMSLAVMHKLMI